MKCLCYILSVFIAIMILAYILNSLLVSKLLLMWDFPSKKIEDKTVIKNRK